MMTMILVTLTRVRTKVIASVYAMAKLTKDPQHVNTPSGIFRLLLKHKLTVNTVDKRLSSRIFNRERRHVRASGKHGKRGCLFKKG